MCRTLTEKVALFFSLGYLFTMIVVGVAKVILEPHVKKPIDEVLRPITQLKCGYIFELDGDVKVTVCRHESVDIRIWKNGSSHNGTLYTEIQWRQLVRTIETVEDHMGIIRLDTNEIVFTTDIQSIKLCEIGNDGAPTKNGIILTMTQWLQLVHIKDSINRVLLRRQ